MEILTQIEAYKMPINIGLILITVVVFALSQWNWLRQRAYALMLQAKRLAIAEILKSGEEQEQWVTDMLQAIPWLLFIPYRSKLIMVKYLYRAAKDLCDDGKLNNSI